MKANNERGVTLLEVLAVLTLVSMVAVLIMTTLFIANRHHLTETSKLKMQQEANYIITTILQKHRTVKEEYTLKLNDEGNLVFIDSEYPEDEILIGKDFDYEMTDIYIGNRPREEKKLSEERLVVKPKKDIITAKLIVTHPTNKKLFVSVDTTFKRYQTEK